MNTDRSRFVCYFCTKKLHGLVVCDGPTCPRCTRACNVQRILSPDEPPPQRQTYGQRLLTDILARHAAMGHFKLERKPQ